MFTLKLYRHAPAGRLNTQISCVHHVHVQDLKPEGSKTLCLWAFRNEHDYDEVFIGETPPGWNKDDGTEVWQWGLLENWEGNTTQHFRPASFG